MTSRGAAGSLWWQAATFYEVVIEKLVPRCDKCPNNGGNYLEK
jgi:hypothetical protein